MNRNIFFRVALLLTAVVAICAGCSNDRPTEPNAPSPGEGPTLSTQLLLAPIPGITTAWHPAPSSFAIPGETKAIRFVCPAPQGTSVTWLGASVVTRDESRSTAEYVVPPAGGRVRVEATVTSPDNEGEFEVKRYVCSFDVVDVPIADVGIGDVSVVAAMQPLGDQITTAERMTVLLGERSISPLKRLSSEHYRTSVATPLRVGATLDNASFASLVEWRIDGDAVLLGNSGEIVLPNDPGTHVISVGPPANASQVSIDTYRALVTIDGDAMIPGRPTTFRVTTEPAGFENEVVWMSATLFGQATPVIGEGATFVTTFEKPWPTPGDARAMCMGVRASSIAVIIEGEYWVADLVRMDGAFDDLADELGKHVCCIEDSLARAQLYDAINGMVKARNAVSDGLAMYQGLGKVAKAVVNTAYGSNVGKQMQTELANIEASIAELKAAPACPPPNLNQVATLSTNYPQLFCTLAIGMQVLGYIQYGLGAILLVPLPPAGVSMITCGTLCLVTGGVLQAIANGLGFECPP